MSKPKKIAISYTAAVVVGFIIAALDITNLFLIAFIGAVLVLVLVPWIERRDNGN